MAAISISTAIEQAIIAIIQSHFVTGAVGLDPDLPASCKLADNTKVGVAEALIEGDYNAGPLMKVWAGQESNRQTMVGAGPGKLVYMATHPLTISGVSQPYIGDGTRPQAIADAELMAMKLIKYIAATPIGVLNLGTTTGEEAHVIFTNPQASAPHTSTAGTAESGYKGIFTATWDVWLRVKTG